MADVKALHALRYDTATAGPLSDLTAPPYDVITPAGRAQLLERSPHNIVAIDLPQMADNGKLEDGGRLDGESRGDPYAAAGALFTRWQAEGVLRADEQPALWAHTQEYTGPDGIARTRRGFFCRVRLEPYGPGKVRPHERTHPGPKEDRLRLMRTTAANLSPIFSLYSDPSHRAWDALAPDGSVAPDGEVADGEGTVHRIWRVGDAERIAAVEGALSNAELLIADGHHRYETARTYAEEIGGEGPHCYVLMCLVALEDPGLTIFPTHRLVRNLDAEQRQRLQSALARDFDMQAVALENVVPEPGLAPLQLGYLDRRMQPMSLSLKDQAIADAALADHGEAYRKLDTGVLEALLLKGALRYSDEDIAELNGLWYASDERSPTELVRSGEYEAAFFMRPTPVAQVRDVAGAGESMPPKSTFFYPKLLTGMLINPLR